MTTTISRKIKQLEERIGRIKAEIGDLGPMRPGSISRQYRNPKERKTPYHQISYTHRMKSRTEYLRAENLKAVRQEVSTFKRFRKLVDQWTDAALELSHLKTRLGLHSDRD
jgi:regulator of replication initiation timing